MTVELDIGCGFTTLLDEADFPLIVGYGWCCEHPRSHLPYAVARQKGRPVRIRMHRLLMGARPDQEVDHIDGNTLDNRRSNLRLASRAENGRNRRLNSNSASGVRGVNRGHSGAWESRIKVDGHTIYLGTFSTIEEAAGARRGAEIFYFGEFAPKAREEMGR